MSDEAGEKTELPTMKRLEDAAKKGQIPRSAELQTFVVLGTGLMALKMAGPNLLANLEPLFRQTFSQLHLIEIKADQIPSFAAQGALLIGSCLAPILLATAAAGLVIGGVQTRFRIASEALHGDWNRVNPIEGFKRIFSKQAYITTGFSLVKLLIIGSISWKTFQEVLNDPIFHTSLRMEDIARFLVQTAMRLGNLLLLSIMVFAGIDYFYQFWHTLKNLMMSKQELKEEFKNQEGDPQMKARMRRRRKRAKTQQQILAEVPQADVIVTNPTHIAIAIKYDRKRMRAPQIIAKGARFNALKIREVAEKNQIPIIENKPVARLMFKHGRVGGEIPAELYTAVAEILAWVYRINRYRYYSEQNQSNYAEKQNTAVIAAGAK